MKVFRKSRMRRDLSKDSTRYGFLVMLESLNNKGLGYIVVKISIIVISYGLSIHCHQSSINRPTTKRECLS